ncbi:gamma-glutamylcyclotransferase [Carnobacterium iners]|uniref:gamma-glutamylcyclotransferase n=1 Tax=Carnobacterium iners TaxID=1073423 RepID=UPI000A1C8936|nr:gamma-glutamylcyclotransferase [Carnobacterium iners]
MKSKAKKSRIKDILYDLSYKGYPAIISNEKNNRWVYSEVYDLIDFESTIIPLDKLESYYGNLSLIMNMKEKIKKLNYGIPNIINMNV